MRHRVPPDVLLLVTVLFWSFNFTVEHLRYSPLGNSCKYTILTVLAAYNGLCQIP